MFQRPDTDQMGASFSFAREPKRLEASIRMLVFRECAVEGSDVGQFICPFAHCCRGLASPFHEIFVLAPIGDFCHLFTPFPQVAPVGLIEPVVLGGRYFSPGGSGDQVNLFGVDEFIEIQLCPYDVGVFFGILVNEFSPEWQYILDLQGFGVE